MQLTLNTETAVDIKVKMSLNEDNLEKCALNVHSAVPNGDAPIGGNQKEENATGGRSKNDKTEQVIENSGTDFEETKNYAISGDVHIKTLHENEFVIDQAVDVENGKNCDTNNESAAQINDLNEKNASETKHNDHNSFPTVLEINNTDKHADEKETVPGVPIKEDDSDNIDINTETKLNQGNKFNDIVNINTQTELNNEKSMVNSSKFMCKTNNLINDGNDVDITNTDAELDDENIIVNSTADTTQNTTVEKESNQVIGIDAEVETNDVDEVHYENVTKINNANNNKDVSTNIVADPENIKTAINAKEIESNHLSYTVDANKLVSGVIENVFSEEKLDNDVIMPEVASTVKIPEPEINSTNNEKINLDEGTITDTINIEVNKGNVCITQANSGSHKKETNISASADKVNMETDEVDSNNENFDIKNLNESNKIKINISASVDKVNMETDDVDVSDEHLDLIHLNETNEKITNISSSVDKVQIETDEANTSDENIDLISLNAKESDGVIESIIKDLEETECRMMDLEEKEEMTDSTDASKKLSLMDVDEPTNNAKAKVMSVTNEEISPENSISNVNENSDNVATVDCNLIEPVSTQKSKTVDLVPSSSDDIIFNLDDDKEPKTDSLKSMNSESTKVAEDCDKPVISCDDVTVKPDDVPVSKSTDEIIDLDDNMPKDSTERRLENTLETTADETKIPPVLKLSNTLDILSDEEDESKETKTDSKCINIEDDDDVMLIDEDTGSNERKTEPAKETETENQEEPKPGSPVTKTEGGEIEKIETELTSEKETAISDKEVTELKQAPEVEEKLQDTISECENTVPLLHEKFLKTCKKNLTDMTREELEEFCILKIVESVIDRSSLSEVKAKLKTLTQNIEEYNKKAKMLTKQNRDLQVVLKSLQEDQKEGKDSITPLKITRSVGMQVLMSDKVVQRRKGIGLPPNAPVNKPIRNPVVQSPRPQKPAAPQIPVPRLVPANNPTLKSPNTQQPIVGKITSPLPNGVKSVSPVQKAEKRTHNRIQSVTVDLTDDEPPTKVVNRAQNNPVPPVRLVPSQNLLAAPRPTTVNSPRKVYIPISGPQGQSVRPGQTIMLKTVSSPSPRQRCPPPHMVRMPQNMRIQRPQGMRHPAPLPDCMKQYQPPNWKALPPAPDLKLAKVENGIVISWKIEGYQEDSYEEIASYQLYAYQETASPPNTALWKKIGDVKALPLPMACTLTQFMAGYKYYFAVRAVDIRSRLGPFSLPGSILLLNKM